MKIELEIIKMTVWITYRLVMNFLVLTVMAIVLVLYQSRNKIYVMIR